MHRWFTAVPAYSDAPNVLPGKAYSDKCAQLYKHLGDDAMPHPSCGRITRVPIVKMHTHSPRDGWTDGLTAGQA